MRCTREFVSYVFLKNLIVFFYCFSKQVLGKSLRVDHVLDYKPPKDNEDYDEITRKLHSEGCAPVTQIDPRNIKREESRRPIKREKSPSPSAVVSSRVKRERSDSASKTKVCYQYAYRFGGQSV